MSRRFLDQMIAEDERRQFAQLERAAAAPATYVVVFDFQGPGQRFWSGKRPVTEYPDAAEFRSYGKGKAALGAAAEYMKGKTAELVENYGLAGERAVLSLRVEPNEKRRAPVPA